MTPDPTAALISIGVVVFFFALLGLRYYVRRARWVAEGVQHVDISRFGFPDLMVGSILTLWLALTVVTVLSGNAVNPADAATTNNISVEALIQTVLFHGVLVGGITFSLHARGIPVLELFGFRKVPLRQATKIGLIALIAAWPLIKFITVLTALALGKDAETQSIINFFSEATKKQEWLSIAAIIFTGVIVAPIAEEFVFRGYLYGVTKRYVGPLAATLFTSLLFAAIHFNALSFPSLFVLAICFTLLYEVTGSLAVPMIMHMLFNTSGLLEAFVAGRIQP